MLQAAQAHTTLPAADIDRARRFYDEKLGLTPASEEPGGLFYECASGTRFVLFPTGGRPSGTHTQLGWAVQDITAEVAALKARGVVFEEYDYPELKTIDSVAQTGPHRAAWFKDSEGNLLGLIQSA